MTSPAELLPPPLVWRFQKGANIPKQGHAWPVCPILPWHYWYSFTPEWGLVDLRQGNVQTKPPQCWPWWFSEPLCVYFVIYSITCYSTAIVIRTATMSSSLLVSSSFCLNRMRLSKWGRYCCQTLMSRWQSLNSSCSNRQVSIVFVARPTLHLH